jgi:Xaa-Pro dipeptidase
MLFNEPRAKAYMERCDLDALVATSPVNIRYFTDYVCCFDPVMREYMLSPGSSSHLMQAYAVYPRQGKPALVINPFFAVNATQIWVEDLHLYGGAAVDYGGAGIDLGASAHMPASLRKIPALLENASAIATATDALLSILKDRGLTSARIGLEIERLPQDSLEIIRAGLPGADIRDVTNLLRLLRMVKSPEELSRMTQAAATSEAVAAPILAQARPGTSMRDLSQQYRAGVAAAGADFEHFVYSIRGLGLAQAETDYILADDDSLQCDFGCIHQGYYSDTAVTLAMGKAPRDHMARYADVRATVDTAVEMMKPGTRASAVHGALHATLGERGLPATEGSGHGLGIEIRDYPIIAADNGRRIVDDCVDESSDLPLEENMVLNIEVGFYAATVGVVFIEQTSVVTGDGCRPIVEQDRRFPVEPQS